MTRKDVIGDGDRRLLTKDNNINVYIPHPISTFRKRKSMTAIYEDAPILKESCSLISY